MLKIYQHVPELEVTAYHEGQIKMLKLSEYRGKWLVLLFYPKDFTFVCPTELEEAADLYKDFQEAGAEILSVSTDTIFVHKAWHDTSSAISKINFPMVEDPAGILCRMFGTYLEDKGVSVRATFIIDPDGELKHMEMHHHTLGRSSKETLRRVRALKFSYENEGQECPAGWEPGEKTIVPSLELVGKI